VDDVLEEQLAYYRARAKEYDESLQGIGPTSPAQPEHEEANQEWLQIIHALRALAPVDDVLELACGTGIWTQELTHISRSITAIDGSPEMIEINQAKRGRESNTTVWIYLNGNLKSNMTWSFSRSGSRMCLLLVYRAS
jgi:SAM-dependent methyltransferase